jgi:hypothetical protein
MGLLPDLPRPEAPDAPVRRFMGRVAMVLAAGAFILAMLDDVPQDAAWALDHKIVFRAAVALALFLVGLAFLNIIALIFHGWLFTGFSMGPAQADAEQVAKQNEAAALQDTVNALTKVTTGADEVVSDLHERVAAVESACDIAPPETPPTSLAALLEGEDDEGERG